MSPTPRLSAILALRPLCFLTVAAALLSAAPITAANGDKTGGDKTVASSQTSSGAKPDEKIQFKRDIQPVLADNCLPCHGANEDRRAAGLRLDTREGAVADLGGYAAVVPGKPEKSELVKRIHSADAPMPPKRTGKTLTAEQKQKLEQWIAQGAPYEAEEKPAAKEDSAPVKPANAKPAETKPVSPKAAASLPQPPRSSAAKPTATKPTNAKPTNAKPTGAKPANASTLVAKPAVETLQFSRDIQPILSDNCFLCHGPDQQKAKLRLDDRAVAIARGAIVPGDPAKSKLIARIFSDDPNIKMPPDASHKTLTAEQKNKLKQWIAEGAPYQSHWAFGAPRKAAPPKIADAAWAKNPIDNFIAAALEKRGLKPSPQASKELLLRRVSFDLIGLPPTSAETDAFLSDTSPDAYEKVVDRLLASPRYGEHMARGWLDAARYADTHGLHFDNERHIWPYRDWVVKAFNENLPFDQFTIYQLAGDLLPNPTRDQLVATGFNRCTPTTNEGGSIDAESLFRYAVDRTETTSSVYMGLTAGCATCHDHKFDPISQKEFYQLYAFFNSAADPAMDGNDLRTPPVLRLPTPEQAAQMAGFEPQISAAQQKIKDAIAKIQYSDPAAQTPPPATTKTETVWMEDSLPAGAEVKADGHPLTFVTTAQGPVKSGQRAIKRSGEGTIQDFFTGAKEPFRVPSQGVIYAHVYLDAKNPPKAVMLQFNTGDWTHRVNWGDADAIGFGTKGTVSKIQAGPLPKTGEWVRLEVKIADLQLKPGTKFSGLAFTQNGGTVYWDRVGVNYESNPATDPETSQRAWEEKLNGKDPGDGFTQDIRDIFKMKPEERKAEHQQKLRDYYLNNVHAGTRELVAPMRGEIAAIEGKKKTLDGEIPATLIMAELPEKRPAHVMLRGAYDKPGEAVQPSTPAVLPPLKTEKPNGRATRLDFAKWLVAPEHPLTARVFVNRLWQQTFGTGLVKTAGDFGAQGEVPSHPELLDWLAVEFREGGWDIKRAMKLLVTSAAYRQDSRVTPQLHELDPENRLLARGPRFRLDAEQIRDNALYVSGLMDFTMGGRGVKPYQPINVWEPLAYPGSNTDKYVQDKGGALYRRSLYTFWKRTAPHPAMSAFDSPNRESSCLRRERSNTPLQALVLMNDVQHFEARARTGAAHSAVGRAEDRGAHRLRLSRCDGSLSD